MERRLKERLIGAAVLVMLAVIFIPMILDDSVDSDTAIRGTNIPARPEGEFTSRIVPLEQKDLQLESVPAGIGVVEQEVAPQEIVDLPEPAPLVEEEPVAPPQEQAAPEAAPVQSAPQTNTTTVPAHVSQEPKGVTAWVVQLGSFSSAENANSLNQRLRKEGFPSFVEPLKQKSGAVIYRVRIGPELLRADAQAVKEKLDKALKGEGVTGIVVQYP